MGIEDKKPYQPSEEEMRKGQEIAGEVEDENKIHESTDNEMKEKYKIQGYSGFGTIPFVGRQYSLGDRQVHDIRVFVPSGIGSELCTAKFSNKTFGAISDLMSVIENSDKSYWALVGGKVIQFNSENEAERSARW